VFEIATHPSVVTRLWSASEFTIGFSVRGIAVVSIRIPATITQTTMSFIFEAECKIERLQELRDLPLLKRHTYEVFSMS
jgi:hypothetical protein